MLLQKGKKKNVHKLNISITFNKFDLINIASHSKNNGEKFTLWKGLQTTRKLRLKFQKKKNIFLPVLFN